MRGVLKKLLAGAPPILVDWAKIAYDFIPPPIRYGKAYRDSLALFKESDWWDEKTLIEYQEALLRRLMHHCYANVPYYRALFDEAGIKPHDISAVSDLMKLPFLDKEIIRRRKKDLLAGNAGALSLEWEMTSGTTGTPLDFQIDLATRAIERALAMRQLLWLGYTKGDVIAEIKEDFFADPESVYRYFPASKQLRFAFFTVDDKKLDKMVEALWRFRPAFIKAFPSSLYILARWIERSGKPVPSVKYIMTSSENLYPSIKEHAERVFGAKVIDHYGENEQVAYAFQCSEAKGYHIQTEQCVMELVPSKHGEWEIVGTSLHNLGMPFVRYRTGDIAIRGDAPCPCGRKHPVIAKIQGRKSEIIVTPERNIIAPVAMDYAFYHLEEIKEGQIIQEDINTLRVRIVPWERISERTTASLMNALNSYLKSPSVKVLIEEVEEIPRTKRGKKRFVISRIKIDDYI